MTYGVSSSTGSIIYGKLLGLVNYNIMVIGISSLYAGIMLFVIVWERESNYIILFLVPVIWGFCNGALLTNSFSKLYISQPTTLVALLEYLKCKAQLLHIKDLVS